MITVYLYGMSAKVSVFGRLDGFIGSPSISCVTLIVRVKEIPRWVYVSCLASWLLKLMAHYVKT